METTEKSVYLRLAEDIFDDALFGFRVIACGVVTLPSAIFSLADVPFPVCSSFWHKISLLCQRTMVTRPSTPLAQTPQRSFQGAAADTHTPSQPLTAHAAAHRAKQGRFGWGALSLPSDRFAWFGNPAWPGLKTANFAVFGSWPGALPKNAESLRNSDALMRVAVPRRRGPARLRSPYCGVLGFPAFA